MQVRKVIEADLERLRPVLEADAWKYAGPMASAPTVHRFVRETESAPAGDTVIRPEDTYIKLRGWFA